MGPGKQLFLSLAQVFLPRSAHPCDLLRNHFVAPRKPHILGQCSETPSLPTPGLSSTLLCQHLAASLSEQGGVEPLCPLS